MSAERRLEMQGLALGAGGAENRRHVPSRLGAWTASLATVSSAPVEKKRIDRGNPIDPLGCLVELRGVEPLTC